MVVGNRRRELEEMTRRPGSGDLGESMLSLKMMQIAVGLAFFGLWALAGQIYIRDC